MGLSNQRGEGYDIWRKTASAEEKERILPGVAGGAAGNYQTGGDLANQRRVDRYIGLGFLFWALAGIPFVMSPAGQMGRVLGMAVFFLLGVAAFAAGAVSERAEYRGFKEEPLRLDPGARAEFSDEFQRKKNVYDAVLVPSTVLFVGGLMAVTFTMQGKFDWSEYHAFVFLGTGAGLFGLCYCAGMSDAYELLIRNGEHVGNVLWKLRRKIREAMGKW